ncbi:hypothetical protein I302_101400 [Kwoniella bestiolae CBS 10118]|uniref:Phosphatidylinositol glycan, class S n=1 Tax=Kwoniella bestiolae CBS 10118 TaxID=1296100 RepID=A0A1B9GC52_9TREE|nr:phosphatidylinositol glycan, class S [Kwoniella bestiolae CBS 10118]OCF28594.1 phosphatidylinositol glycan, class S [Kwoniella bestiolae CBS 10118]
MSLSDPHHSAGPSKQIQDRTIEVKPTPAEVTKLINPSNKRRLLITLSFPLLFLLAVPFWWYTTSIERLPLPVSRIDALESLSIPSYRGKILFTADEDAYPKPAPGRPRFENKVICQSLGKVVMDGVDSIYERKRPQKKRNWELIYEGEDDLRNPTPFRVHIRRFQHANNSWPLEPYVQPYETGLMTSGIKPGTLVIPVHPDQIGDRNLKQHYKIAMINSLLSLYPPDPPTIPLRALKYSPNITLSFVLLNEDSTEGSYVRSWEIDNAIKEHFIPHLEPLKDIFNFTIESQILYHAPLTFEPPLDYSPSSSPENPQIDAAIRAAEHGDEGAEQVARDLIQEDRSQSWYVGEEDMKAFVNSERWSLDSGSTNNPVLRFLLYVPKEKHRPMRLAGEDSPHSFLLPQFGSVYLLNPPPSASTSSTHTETYHLPSTALKSSFHLFTQHLYSLLALPTLYDPGKIHLPPASSPLSPRSEIWQAITPWQVNQVLESRLRENFEESRKTLVGIKRLVDKIKEMKVSKGVRDDVEGAVKGLERISPSNSPLENFIHSRDSVNLANKAFFDPSMMGLLYFPDEHKFAVYTPLFAPIAVPLLLGLIKEFVAWRKRRSGKATKENDKKETEKQKEVKVEADGNREVNVDVDPARSSILLEPDVTSGGRERVLRSRSKG